MKTLFFYTSMLAGIILYCMTIDIIKKINKNIEVPGYEIAIASVLTGYIIGCIELISVP